MTTNKLAVDENSIDKMTADKMSNCIDKLTADVEAK